jgi:hypothetical protein
MMLVLPAVGIRAQSVSDDIEQLVLDVQKLTQLKQILSDMYTAYTVVSQGYDNIKNLSQGTFSLHKVFLDGLLAVSPVVQNYVKVTDIINKQVLLVKEYKAANSYYRSNGHFTSAELDYFSAMYANLFNGSLKNLDELAMVITANQLRMSDAERLAAIDRIDRDITGKLSFLRLFNNSASLQSAQRTRDDNDVEALQSLYGISH